MNTLSTILPVDILLVSTRGQAENKPLNNIWSYSQAEIKRPGYWRRKMKKNIVVCLLVLALVGFGWTGAFAQAEKPNILFIMADDLGNADLG